MSPENTEIMLGRLKLKVPVYKSAEFTQKIADEVTKRLQEIESQSDRIDTQAFALSAAMSYAIEVAKARDEASSDTRQMLLALNRISEALRDLLKEGIDE